MAGEFVAWFGNGALKFLRQTIWRLTLTLAVLKFYHIPRHPIFNKR
jgi:hypothetical protein